MVRYYYWYISIGSIIGICVVLFIYSSFMRTLEKMETERAGYTTDNNDVINNNLKDYEYFIKEQDGTVYVYTTNDQKLYEEVKIDVQKLPEKEQVYLKGGIYVKDKDELFCILEGYSS